MEETESPQGAQGGRHDSVSQNSVFTEFLISLPNDVRQESHEAGTLYGLSKCALVYGREARAAARHDFAVRIDEFF